MFKSKRAENGNRIPITEKQKPERWKETSKIGDQADGESSVEGAQMRKKDSMYVWKCVLLYKSMCAIMNPKHVC